MTSPTPIDTHLAEVAALMMLFKGDSLRSACIAIAKAGCHGTFWPDEVLLQLPKDDGNCIGNAYKLMADTLGVIEKIRPLEDRRSTAGPSKGRTIFRYRTVDMRRCRLIAALALAQGELL